MDPNTNLSEQLRLAYQALDSEGPELTKGSACLLAELVIDLHEWIIKGGFLPDKWEIAQKRARE